MHNRWFLDPVLLGEYPADILDLYSAEADLGIYGATFVTAGFGSDDDALVDGAVDDTLRQHYITLHLEQAHRAIDDGVDLRGYFVWSCFDNFEWIFGYANRFGLVHIDFDTQQRTWKDSAFIYQRYIRDNGF